MILDWNMLSLSQEEMSLIVKYSWGNPLVVSIFIISLISFISLSADD